MMRIARCGDSHLRVTPDLGSPQRLMHKIYTKSLAFMHASVGPDYLPEECVRVEVEMKVLTGPRKIPCGYIPSKRDVYWLMPGNRKVNSGSICFSSARRSVSVMRFCTVTAFTLLNLPLACAAQATPAGSIPPRSWVD